MSTKSILHINSSGRYNGSITRQVSEELSRQLQKNNTSLDTVNRDLATGLPFVNEQWINANFTVPGQRNDHQKDVLSLSDSLVLELQNAEVLVIASPIYNFGIPAVLKAWVDLVARVGLTFRYTENGPIGLLDDKLTYIVMASGGVPIGSEMDSASKYLKQVLSFIGITKVSVIDATEIDLKLKQNLLV